jgi:hypothetical protein
MPPNQKGENAKQSNLRSSKHTFPQSRIRPRYRAIFASLARR